MKITLMLVVLVLGLTFEDNKFASAIPGPYADCSAITANFCPFWRFWNNMNHFYTVDPTEPGIAPAGHKVEGIACLLSPKKVFGLVPLYRYYNGNDHFYTTNGGEIGTTTLGAVGNGGYKCEGPAGYCFPSQRCGSIPLYRYFNGVDHFYTVSATEIGTITPGAVGNGNYKFEGVACYVMYAPE